MPPTVAQVQQRPGLELRVLAGAGGLARPVRLVHTSEVDDPTPWLRGEELLLTTGMRLDPDAFPAYVARLAASGVAALGLGVGVRYDTAPPQLTEAAEHHELPLLRIPYETPFVAISEAVFSDIAEEHAAAAAHAYDSQQELTRCALRDGPWEGVVPRLARLLRGWCVVTDDEGTALASAPSVSEERMARLRPELERVRVLGGRGAGTAILPGDTTVIQPLTVGSEVPGHLVAGKSEPFDEFDRMVVSSAVSLLSLEMAHARSVDRAENRFRAELVNLLLTGQLAGTTGREAVRSWGLRPDAVRVGVCLGAELERVRSARLPGVVFGRREGRELWFLAGDEHAAEAVAHRASAGATGSPGGTGISQPTAADRISTAVAEARLAARIAESDGGGHTAFDRLDGVRLLFGAGDPEALRGYADRVLGPLEHHDREGRGELIRSLDTFLRNGENVDRTADELGVHRNTVRHRIHRAEELTGKRLAAPYGRVEFWLALQLRGLTGPPG